MGERNASASAFGWDFQTNAAILLMLENIKEADKIRVEGADEDIEITLNDKTKIYSQVKAVAKPDDYAHVIDKLTDALETLNLDANKTLLNRGKVIGNISFNIESLVRGLGGKNCEEQLNELDAVKRQIKKYEYMHSVADYQEQINEAGEDIVFDSADEVVDRKIEILRSERMPIVDELKQIKDILRKNKLLAEYIDEMK